MKLTNLESAIEGLHRGREFYARYGAGVGEYFLDSFFSDIDSLVLYAGIHQKAFGTLFETPKAPTTPRDHRWRRSL